MRLCHLTDQTGRDVIEAEGFRQKDPPEGPAWDSPERGVVWFASSKSAAYEVGWRTGWWIWVDVPDDTPQYVFANGDSYPGKYALPIDYVNTLAMTFERET